MKSIDVIGAVFFDELDQICTQAGENGRNRDNRRYTDHDAEDRQRASEFMSPDAVEGHRDDLRVRDSADIHWLSILRQCDDRIKPGGAKCRIDARDHTDTTRNDEGQNDVWNCDCHRNRRRDRDEPGYAGGYQQAEYTSERCKQNRFDQKLQKDLSPARTEGFAQADFKSTFCDADQHDVHHDNASDHKRDQSDRRDDSGDRSRKLIYLVIHLLNVDEPEIVFLVALQLVVNPHRHSPLVEGPLKQLPGACFAVDLQALCPSEHPSIRCDRNISVVIQRLAEHRAALLLDSNNAHRSTCDLDGFVYRICLRKELFTKFCADYDHRRGRLYFIRPDEPPIVDRFIFDLRHIGGDAVDVSAEELFTILLKINRSRCRRTDFLTERTICQHPLEVVQSQPLVSLVPLLPFLFAQRTDVCHARNHEVVYAEYPRNAIYDVRVEAAYRRPHQNHRSDTNDDPDQRQECSELMRPDGPKGNPKSFRVKGISVFHA